MSEQRAPPQRAPIAERRAPTAARSVEARRAPSAAQAQQQRFGVAGSQVLMQRSAERVAQRQAVSIQHEVPVSSPRDAAEIEAVSTAQRIMRAPAVAAPAISPQATAAHRSADGSGPHSTAMPSTGGGQPLPPDLKSFMEQRLGADFSQVRIHTDEQAAKQSASLSARAFTVGEHVYFGKNEYRPDSSEGRELIAHELTHTIQQGKAPQAGAAQPVARRATVQVQRWGVGDALNKVAEKANGIPGFRMLTIVLGMNPVNFAAVERSPANVLRAVLELIPVAGPLLAQALANHGIFEKVGAWIEAKLRTLGLAASALKAALSTLLDSLNWRDIFDLGGVWDRAKKIFSEPIDRITAFVTSLVVEVLGFIREAILLPLAALAAQTQGYDLMCAVLGQDPVSGAKVQRTPQLLIGGFMKLIGEEEIWVNIQKANAVPRCWAWFQGALASLMGFVQQIPGLFMTALKSLEIIDLILVPKAFIKVGAVFGGFALQFLKWAGGTVLKLLELIFEVVSPATLAYLRRTGTALVGILRNPLPFVHNLVAAAKLGFVNFADRFGAHLKAGLLDWLTGSLPGVYIPKNFSLGELVKFVFSVLGISWQSIRAKLVKAVGETAVKAMETGFDIVVTLVTQGPAAAWEKIQEQLTNLKDMVIEGITGLVVDTVIKKAVPKLISMFIPGAGFISAILSIYDTIMVFVDKLARIIEVVKSFVDSIVAIAGGAIDAAAKRVESTLAGLLSLSISFLAGFIGLGSVAEKVMGVITKIRATIDKAIDALIAWIVMMAKKLFAKGKAAVQAVTEWWKQKQPFTTASGEKHELSYVGDEKNAVAIISTDPAPATTHLDRFADQAAAPGASPEEKKGLALVQQARAALKKDPSDPNLTVVFKAVFDTYGSVGDKKTIITSTTGSFGGSTVGLSMTADWLWQKHPKGSPSSRSEQVQLMSQLITEPKNPSADKFIRGHLLNEELGGLGVAANMFPITANANSQHLRSTESKVKKWVNEKSPDGKQYWVYYEVKVVGIQSKLVASKGGTPDPGNFVDCTFVTHAILKDAKGKAKEDFSAVIPSVYQEKQTAVTAVNIAGGKTIK